jgi:hypothetical protein
MVFAVDCCVILKVARGDYVVFVLSYPANDSAGHGLDHVAIRRHQDCSRIEEDAVIRAEAKDVVCRVRAPMWIAKWAHVHCLGVDARWRA